MGEPRRGIRGRPLDPASCRVREFYSDEEKTERSRKGGRGKARTYALARLQRDLARRGKRIHVDEHRQAVEKLQDSERRLIELYQDGRLSLSELPQHLAWKVTQN